MFPHFYDICFKLSKAQDAAAFYPLPSLCCLCLCPLSCEYLSSGLLVIIYSSDVLAQFPIKINEIFHGVSHKTIWKSCQRRSIIINVVPVLGERGLQLLAPPTQYSPGSRRRGEHFEVASLLPGETPIFFPLLQWRSWHFYAFPSLFIIEKRKVLPHFCFLICQVYAAL